MGWGRGGQAKRVGVKILHFESCGQIVGSIRFTQLGVTLMESLLAGVKRVRGRRRGFIECGGWMGAVSHRQAIDATPPPPRAPRPLRAAACCRPTALAKVSKRPNFYYEINITDTQCAHSFNRNVSFLVMENWGFLHTFKKRQLHRTVIKVQKEINTYFNELPRWLSLLFNSFINCKIGGCNLCNYPNIMSLIDVYWAVCNYNSYKCARDGHNGSGIIITIGWLARVTGGQEADVGDGNAAVLPPTGDMTSAHRYSLVLRTFNAHQFKRACTVNASLFQMKHAIKVKFRNPLLFLPSAVARLPRKLFNKSLLHLFDITAACKF